MSKTTVLPANLRRKSPRRRAPHRLQSLRPHGPRKPRLHPPRLNRPTGKSDSSSDVTTGKWMVGIGLGIGLLLIIFVNSTKNESPPFDTPPVAQAPGLGCPRLSTATSRASHAEAAACPRGTHPAKRSHGIRERARPAGRVLESKWLLHTGQVGARSGADGLGTALPRRRFSPRACGSPLLRTGGLPEGAQGNAGSLAANPASSARREISSESNAARGVPVQAFPSRVHG
jgi:hypothetical protein